MIETFDAVGSPASRVAVVLESPNSDELRANKPLMSKSAGVLERALGNAGIISPYITYVIKTDVLWKDIENYVKVGHRGKITLHPMFNHYREALKNELMDTTSNVIIASGKTALYALCGTHKIQQYRGSVIESTLLPGRKVVPIIDYKKAIKQPALIPTIGFDCHNARNASRTKGFNYEPRLLRILPSFEESLAWFQLLQDGEPLAFDIEVANGEVSHLSFATPSNGAVSICLWKQGVHFMQEWEEYQLLSLVSEILYDNKRTKIIHNASFDMTFIYERYKMVTRNVWDTIIAHSILYPGTSKGLAYVNSQYTDVPYYKDEGKAHFSQGQTGSSEVLGNYLSSLGYLFDKRDFFDVYSALDASILIDIQRAQEKELNKAKNMETFQRQSSVLESVNFMVQHAYRADIPRIRKLSGEMDLQIAEEQVKLNETAGKELNANSWKQLQDYFYKEKGITPITSKGKITTDATAMSRISAKGYKEAQHILKIRELVKMRSTYLGVKFDDAGRFRYSINPVGTRFGRFSSSKDIFGRGGNVQNLPKAFREFLLVDEDHVAYEIDLSQAEARIVGYLGNEIKMIEAFESGIDVHSLTASFIFGISIDDSIVLHKEWEDRGSPMGDPDCCPSIGNYRQDYRAWGKAANHSLNYGLGPGQFSIKYECSMSEARNIIEKYHRAYPGVKRYQKKIERLVRDGEPLVNLYDRRYRLRLFHFNDIKQGYDFVAQSTVADKINEDGLVPLYHMDHVKIISQVHDSIIFQLPLSIPLELHHSTLLQACNKLEKPLMSWFNEEFILPTSCKIYRENFRFGEELDIHSLSVNAFKQLVNGGEKQS